MAKSNGSNLNWKEERVVKALRTVEYATIRWVARKCFPGVRPATKADSQVRNSVRKPIKIGLVARHARGVLRAAQLPLIDDAPAPATAEVQA